MTAVRELTDDEAITYAILFGCGFYYHDYGHPERAKARQYWKCSGRVWEFYGYTQAQAARRWLYHVVDARGEFTL
jgi:hypothetical protein